MFNLFLFITELNIAYYADDTTLYECKANLIEVQTKKKIKIKTEILKVYEWFRNSYLILTILCE